MAVPSCAHALGLLCTGGSMFYEEHEDMTHELYEETIVTKKGQKQAKLRRVHKKVILQDNVELEVPRIHEDFPVVLYEV